MFSQVRVERPTGGPRRPRVPYSHESPGEKEMSHDEDEYGRPNDCQRFFQQAGMGFKLPSGPGLRGGRMPDRALHIQRGELVLGPSPSDVSARLRTASLTAIQ